MIRWVSFLVLVEVGDLPTEICYLPHATTYTSLGQSESTVWREI